MPSALDARAQLDWMISHGRSDEKVHLVLVEEEQKARIKNNKRKQNFVLCTGDPDLCSEFESEKDRIFRKVHNKTLMLELMIRAWKQALADPELDRILAVMEMQ